MQQAQISSTKGILVKLYPVIKCISVQKGVMPKEVEQRNLHLAGGGLTRKKVQIVVKTFPEQSCKCYCFN